MKRIKLGDNGIHPSEVQEGNSGEETGDKRIEENQETGKHQVVQTQEAPPLSRACIDRLYLGLKLWPKLC